MRLKAIAFILSTLTGLKFAFLYKSTVYAASNGALGETSVGTTDISMEIFEQVRVTNVVDFSLDNGDGNARYVAGAGDVSDTSVICIYYNNGTAVELTMDSTNGSGSYLLDDGSANSITYTVDVDEGNDGTFTSHGEGASIVYPNMADNQLNCAGGTFNAVRVTVADTGNLGLPNGTYTDTLTYTIAPTP